MLWLVNRWQTINIISLALWPLSIIYCVIVVLRRLAYQIGGLKSYAIDLPVMVVGNITVGGTGKTPLVIWLVDWLKTQGHRPGIVLRGYGGNSNTWPRRVQAETSPIEVGDEAVLLASRTGCPVVVAPDRVAAARELVSNTDCTIIISDDGLQHYRMRRDYEISVVDGQRGYGNGFCLPAGPLREPVARAKMVNLVVINGRPKKGALTMEIKPVVFRNLKSNQKVSLGEFQNRAVHAIAGIGNPDRFFNTLGDIGIVATIHPFPDHYRFGESDLDFGDDRDIIMTEKDAVKCVHFTGANCWALEVDAVPSAAVVERLTFWIEETGVG